MKKNWMLIIAVALLLCIAIVFMACNDDPDYVYETDENGETVTDDEGNPVAVTDEDGEKVTTNPESSNSEPIESSKGKINAEGANTEEGWGKIIVPN